jgi:hypothetical protein
LLVQATEWLDAMASGNPLRDGPSAAQAKEFVERARAALGSAPPQEPDKFRHIAALGENWDSYGAHPIAPAAIAAARNFLDWGLTGYVSVVPSSDSGVQLEWHYSGADIEVKFAPDGAVSVFAENAGEGSAPRETPDPQERTE